MPIDKKNKIEGLLSKQNLSSVPNVYQSPLSYLPFVGIIKDCTNVHLPGGYMGEKFMSLLTLTAYSLTAPLCYTDKTIEFFFIHCHCDFSLSVCFRALFSKYGLNLTPGLSL